MQSVMSIVGLQVEDAVGRTACVAAAAAMLCVRVGEAEGGETDAAEGERVSSGMIQSVMRSKGACGWQRRWGADTQAGVAMVLRPQ